MKGDPGIRVRCGIVILAAGGSSRLGQAKQLLPYQGSTLAGHAALTALATGLHPVVVVLGDRAEEIKKELEGLAIHLVVNEHWQEGMAGTLKKGLDAALELDPALEAVIFMVCDQPLVSPALLLRLLGTHEEHWKPIVASRYQENLGTPALFAHSVFPALRELIGDTGARKLIRDYGEAVSEVDFPGGHIDIDTKQDYESFLKRDA